MTLKPYQQQLEAFIAPVPQLGEASQRNNDTGVSYWGEVRSGSPVLQRNPYETEEDKKRYKATVEKASVSNNPTFTQLTNQTHQQLLNSWKEGGHLTSCLEFVIKAVSAMGVRGLTVGFNLLDKLAADKKHCWITPASGQQPRFGDLFETRRLPRSGQGYENLHVGISLQIDKDGIWHTIEGGQGGPSSLGYDRVARCRRKYNDATAHLLGWVDMKLFLLHPVPNWLLGANGWWVIYCGKEIYYYRFDKSYQAFQYRPIPGWLKSLPLVGSTGARIPGIPLDMGEVEFQNPNSFHVKWSREGGTEVFEYDSVASNPGLHHVLIKGRSSCGEQLSGVRADGVSL
jgi:hypothetical protein